MHDLWTYNFILKYYELVADLPIHLLNRGLVRTLIPLVGRLCACWDLITDI
jgi:hypothetical protein